MIRWDWQVEPDPPLPKGVVAVGAVAPRLLRAVERALAPSAPQWMLSANADLLALTGDAASLPWVDGVHYIAPRQEAPGLWLPTTLRPNVPLDLLAQALRRVHSHEPALLLHRPTVIFPLSGQLPVSAALLHKVRARWQGVRA